MTRSNAYRFAIGTATATIVSDGAVVSGDPRVTHPRPDPKDVERLLLRHDLPVDHLLFDENILVLGRGDGLIVFDTGLGQPAEIPAWGTRAGYLAENLEAAGIEVRDVGHVVLSHGHSEHVGGLIGRDGSLAFPNARIYISEKEYDFWTNPDRTGSRWRFDHERALDALARNQERITFIADQEEFLPGITALSTPGHSIDHMAFMVRNGTERLCYTADAARHFVLNVEEPAWQFIGDADGAQTVESRLRLFDFLAEQAIPIVSYHFPWPGLGFIERHGRSYRFRPSDGCAQTR